MVEGQEASALRRRRSHLVSTLCVALFLIAALWLLWLEVRTTKISEIRAGLEQIPASHIWLAAGLTIANYVLLIGFDWLGVWSIGHPLPLKKVSLAALIGYPVSHNFGAIVGGSSVRYRLYASWGLSVLEILRLIAILGLTFWTGMFALTGLVFVTNPLPLPELLDKLPFADTRPIGIVLILIVACYLAITALKRRTIGFRSWQFPVPTLRISVAQLTIAAVDLAIAASVLYFLLPPALRISYPDFLAIYLLAVLAVVITHVPGGVGVFELVVIKSFPAEYTEEVVAALLLNRLVYYLLPLLFAGMLFVAHEISLHMRPRVHEECELPT